MKTWGRGEKAIDICTLHGGIINLDVAKIILAGMPSSLHALHIYMHACDSVTCIILACISPLS